MIRHRDLAAHYQLPGWRFRHTPKNSTAAEANIRVSEIGRVKNTAAPLSASISAERRLRSSSGPRISARPRLSAENPPF